MTLRQALASLVEDRTIYVVPGVGTFVSEKSITKEVLLSSFTEDMNRRGVTPSSRVLMAQVIQPPSNIAVALDLEESEKTYQVERLRMGDSVPICLEDVHLPATAYPGLLEQNLEHSLYKILRERYERGVVTANTIVRASIVNKRQADLLGVPLKSPALVFERIGFDERGRPIEHCQSVFRADRFDLRYTVDL